MTDAEIDSLVYDYDGSRRFRELCAALDQAREANRLRAVIEESLSHPCCQWCRKCEATLREALKGRAE